MPRLPQVLQCMFFTLQRPDLEDPEVSCVYYPHNNAQMPQLLYATSDVAHCSFTRCGTSLTWRIRTLLCKRLSALSLHDEASDSGLAGDHVLDRTYTPLPDGELDPCLPDGPETSCHVPHESAHPLVLGVCARILSLQDLYLTGQPLTSARRDVGHQRILPFHHAVSQGSSTTRFTICRGRRH